MNSASSFRSILLALTAGALGVMGCVITVGEVDCSECSADVEPDALCHSSYNPATNSCECDDNYEFASNAPDDFECERSEARPATGDCGVDPNTGVNGAGDCICENGTVWCSDDPADLTCCDPTGGSGGVSSETTPDTTGDTDPSVTDTDTDDPTTGADSSGSDSGPVDLPPCDADTEGGVACTNDGDVNGVEGSEAFFCQGGEWMPVDMDAECSAVGDDFAYGCFFNDADEVVYECATGPGTPCTDADDTCSGDTLQSCLFGKLTDIDCVEFCTGDEAKEQFDHGECDADGLTCFCCDEGDEGCPV